jgi:hypothetical protein
MSALSLRLLISSLASLFIDDRLIPSIIITGCGYPDIATRAAVHKIANVSPVSTFFHSQSIHYLLVEFDE